MAALEGMRVLEFTPDEALRHARPGRLTAEPDLDRTDLQTLDGVIA